MIDSLLLRYFNRKIPLNSNDSYLLIIENKNVFYNSLRALCNENYDAFLGVISEDKKIDISDYVDCSSSIIGLDINSKKNLNAISKQIKKAYIDKINLAYANVYEILNSLSKDICLDYSVNLYSDIDLSNDDIVKMMNYQIIDESQSAIEKMILYIKVAIELRGIKVFIFYGMRQFLDENDFVTILKECKMMDVILIDIESINVENEKFDHKLILDVDNCIIE